MMDPGSVLDLDPDSNFFLLNFFCIRFKTHNDVFFVVFLSLLFSYIKHKSDFLKKKYIFIILVDLYASLSLFFLVHGSRSTFPDADPDPGQ